MITLFVFTMMILGFAGRLIGLMIRLCFALLPYAVLYYLFRSLFYRRY